MFGKIKTMGNLEEEVMGIVWKNGESSVRFVLEKLNKKRDIAYTTVMTVLTRLYLKGLLKRKSDNSGAYLYSPMESKEKFLAKTSKSVISQLIKNYGDIAVAQFFDAIENSKVKDWRDKLDKYGK